MAERKPGFKHGTPDGYHSWDHMIQRCTNHNNKAWHNYGGRGITVCDRWKNSFEAFLEDMGPRPSKRHSIDRIDNDGPYSPENCRWATQKEQHRNRRDTVFLTHQSRTQCMADWADEVGMPRGTLAHRLKRGWSIERALSM